MTDALAKYQETSAGFSLAKEELAEVTAYATLICKSGMVPACYKDNAGAVLLAWDLGASVGLSRIQSLQGIATIGNVPSLWGDAALAVVTCSQMFNDIVEQDVDDIRTAKKASCTISRKRPDGSIKTITRSFSHEDAKDAGLLSKDTYKKYPWRMIQMRARARAMRDLFPDALKGLSIYEEVQDHLHTKVEDGIKQIQDRDAIAEPEEIKVSWFDKLNPFSNREDPDSIVDIELGKEETPLPIAEDLPEGVNIEKIRNAKDLLDASDPDPVDDDLGFISPEQVRAFWKWSESNGIDALFILDKLKLLYKVDTIDELPADKAADFCSMILADWKARKN